MPYSAVAFDLDGTLYPASALYLRAWPAALANARFFAAFSAVRRQLRVLARSEEYRLSLRDRRPAGEGGESALPLSDAPAFRRLQAELTARRLGEDPAATEAFIEKIIYRRVDELFVGLEPYSGLTAALDSLRAAGLRLALLSDFPPGRKLELLGLSGAFEAALCSEDTGFLKPAPESFARLASALRIEAREILYVGNSLAYDLAGAKAAGMGAAILTRRRAPEADLRFRDWKDLVRYVLGRVPHG